VTRGKGALAPAPAPTRRARPEAAQAPGNPSRGKQRRRHSGHRPPATRRHSMPRDRSGAGQEGRPDRSERRRRQHGYAPPPNRAPRAQHASRPDEKGEGPGNSGSSEEGPDPARRPAVERRRGKVEGRGEGGRREERGKGETASRAGFGLAAAAATSGGPGWGGGQRRMASPSRLGERRGEGENQNAGEE
jgi:hypothetical protein